MSEQRSSLSYYEGLADDDDDDDVDDQSEWVKLHDNTAHISPELSNSKRGSKRGGKRKQSDPFLRQRFVEPVWPVPFVEIEVREEDVIASDPRLTDASLAWYHRPFVVMRQLTLSMLDSGMLLSGLHVTKDVWFQSGARLIAQQEKVEFCRTVSEELLQLSAVSTSNHAALKRELQAFMSRAQWRFELLQRSLPLAQKQLKKHHHQQQQQLVSSPSREDQTPSKGIGGKLYGLFGNTTKSLYKGAVGLVSNIAQKDTTTEQHPYIPWLLNLFDKAQFIDRWITQFIDQDRHGRVPLEIKQQLEGIAFFFANNVLRAFVLHDLQALIEQYTCKSLDSLTQLWPKDHVS